MGTTVHTDGRFKIKGATEAQQREVDAMVAKFSLPDNKLKEIISTFRGKMRRGLESDGQQLKMIPAYITERPTGKETGSFFAIDLGGTNLRVLRVNLLGNSKVEIEHQKFSLTDEAKSHTLFDFVAEKIGDFLESKGMLPGKDDKAIPMGFTFSYPVLQTSLASGKLMHWTKGITAPGCVGKDVVRLLHDALLRRHIRVDIVALLNDTVGTLLASAYMHPGSQIGVIFGTGTNAAYYESIRNVEKWKKEAKEPVNDSGEMIINMEWGAFDSGYDVLPVTMHDLKLNRKSPNPDQQGYEKMISGMYLGEIVRNALLHMVDQRLVFGGRSSEILNEAWSIDTMYLTEAMCDTTEDLSNVSEIIEKTLGVPGSTIVDRQIFQALSIMVCDRASRLSGVGLVSTLLQRPELLDKPVMIGADGSMYEYLPGFEELVYDTISKFLTPEQFKNVELTLAKDCSSIGSAIAAMLYSENH
ncbi:hypothetical protein H4219_002444 [Mycoemilia scoparia]|uniref:Phosphotransferase n=1 Tax=Mycoemilia scoparia TaxID=417184 RepID=A0A9W8A2I8_9FUNG|nr:hypothetical protein H4219_002444 [Mycoemilia scoparia]